MIFWQSDFEKTEILVVYRSFLLTHPLKDVKSKIIGIVVISNMILQSFTTKKHIKY